MQQDSFDTERASSDPMQDLRFSWPSMDPNSFNYSLPLGAQANGYCAPPAMGGMGAMFHGLPAPSLHPSPMGLDIAPLPFSANTIPTQHAHGSSDSGTSSRRSSSAALGLDHFNTHYSPGQFHETPFQQGSFAPSAFVHQDGYAPMDTRVDEKVPLKDMNMQLNPVYLDNGQTDQPATEKYRSSRPYYFPKYMLTNLFRFRYNVTLRATTAMIRHPREIPVTYLNKGQTYTLSVVDSSPPIVGSNLVRYRTYVRVSFEEKEQRAKVASCWQLWKEGRGLSEAHQRGGKLLAVECADPLPGPGNSQNDRQVQLESASFDGFCVTWTADPTTGVSFCALSVRFNFLSTDFSHSKGVKGVPVRLCAKTEMISPTENDSVAPTANPEPKVSYCKVKLFRDHGAERKLANDVAHVKKAIEKLKQQIAQAELGASSFGKRKRGSIPATRPSKFLKHSRSWSAIDPPLEGSDKLSLEDDLHTRLVMLQDMFSSTRPVSILNLKGEEQDDPDLYPVQLPDEHYFQEALAKAHTLKHQSTQESLNSVDAPSLTTLSPTNSTVSLSSPQQTSFVRSDSGYHSSGSHSRSFSDFQDKGRYVDHPTKVPKVKNSMESIEAINVDPSYQPPAERLPKPGEYYLLYVPTEAKANDKTVACFYIRFDQGTASSTSDDNYYRAIYLLERTVDGLRRKILEKAKIEANQIARLIYITRNGVEVMVDDDMVQGIPEGQDMIMQLNRVSSPLTPPSVGDAVEIKIKY